MGGGKERRKKEKRGEKERRRKERGGENGEEKKENEGRKRKEMQARAILTFYHLNPTGIAVLQFKTAPTPPEKPLHQRSRSQSRFFRSRSPAKQTRSLEPCC
jgi:SNF2 family DNA or RNA helicase